LVVHLPQMNTDNTEHDAEASPAPLFLEKNKMINQEQLDNWFMYHSPAEDQVDKYNNIRRAAKRFAEILLYNTPPSADQTDAIRKIREAVMTANASIACEGK